MKLNKENIIGLLIIAFVLIALLIITAINIGFVQTAKTWGLAFLSCIFIIYGAKLLAD